MTGHKWFEDAQVKIDKENKITEFEYENYFDPSLARNKDLCSTDEFKRLVRTLNYFQKTRIENYQNNKE